MTNNIWEILGCVDLSATAKLVYIYIKMSGSNDGQNLKLSMLKKHLGLSPVEIVKALKEIADAGLSGVIINEPKDF